MSEAWPPGTPRGPNQWQAGPPPYGDPRANLAQPTLPGTPEHTTRTRRRVNLVAVLVAGVLVVTSVVVLVVAGVSAPTPQDRAMAAAVVDEAGVRAVVPTVAQVGEILDVTSADSAHVSSAVDLDGVIPASVTPASCLPLVTLAPSPVFAVGVDGWTLDDNKLASLGARGAAFVNRASAAAGYDQFAATLVACPEVSYRVTSNAAEISVRYAVTSSVEHGDVPCLEWRAEIGFTDSGIQVKRTEVSRMYLLGNAIFQLSYGFDTAASPPAWATQVVADFESRLHTLIPAVP